MLIKGKPRKKGIYTPVAAFSAAPSGAAYTGPGDIASGAYAWYGLRAYTAAYAAAHGNVIRVCDSTGANFVTITANTDGTITPPGPTACGGNACTLVDTLYDQTGNGHHLTQTTNANRPTFNGTGVFSMNVSGGFSGNYVVNSSITLSQSPGWSVSSVANRVTSTGGNCQYVVNGNSGAGFGSVDATGDVSMSASAASGRSSNVVLLNTIFSGQMNFIGAGSVIYLNATPTTVTSGPMAFAGDPLYLMSYTTDVTKITEVGLWASDQSSFFSALNTNQHTFWGF
jgi:hypothetical protein